ncbi:MAG TPA: hypothetical protein VMG12_36750 [Polyangiaceae bacterium]|nr:hypothetical protein [Polyangiaceae bacterium]
MRGLALLGAMAGGALACGADAAGGDEETPVDSGIEVAHEGDTAFFLHDSADHADALLEGAASISNGCLAVGDPSYVIIWHESWRSHAELMINMLKAGIAAPFVSVGGGEVPSNVPYASEVRALCGTDRVWETGPFEETTLR